MSKSKLVKKLTMILFTLVAVFAVGLTNVNAETTTAVVEDRDALVKKMNDKTTDIVRLNKNIELLDTPGILWPKFDNQEVGKKLAMIGSMNDEVINLDELALDTVKFIIQEYPGNINERYGVDESAESLLVMEEIAAKRGCLKRGGMVDYEKVAGIILDDYRSGRIGRITLEKPEEY